MWELRREDAFYNSSNLRLGSSTTLACVMRLGLSASNLSVFCGGKRSNWEGLAGVSFQITE